MTEEEYRAHPGINYSLLSALDSHPSKVHGDKVDATQDYIVFGDCVDRLLFTPDSFEEKYIVSDFNKPTDRISEVIEAVFADENCPREIEKSKNNAWDKIARLALDHSNYLEYGKNWKPETLIRKIEEAGGWNYLVALDRSRGKTVIGKNMHDNVKSAIMTLTTHEFTAKFFTRMKGVERLYQFPIVVPLRAKTEDIINDIELKILLDIVLINHNNRTIYPIDLKTTGFFANLFPSQFITFKYYLQSALYKYVVQKMVDTEYIDGEKNPLYKYKVGPFRFIVISSINPNYPAVFECSDNDIEIGTNGGHLQTGRKIKGWKQLLKEYLWHRYHNKWDYPYEYYQNNGIIKINAFK